MILYTRDVANKMAFYERAFGMRAIDAGCTSISPPAKRPWRPTSAFVRDDEGVLIELCCPDRVGDRSSLDFDEDV